MIYMINKIVAIQGDQLSKLNPKTDTSIYLAIGAQKLKYKIGKRRNGDVGECYANVNKANKILNWKSKLSIEDSLLSSWNWEKKINNEKL